MYRLSENVVKCETREQLESLIEKHPIILNHGILEDGSSALHLLVQKASPSSLPLIETLLGRGASCDVRDKEGATPLMFSYSLGVTNALLTKGASATIADRSGYTALHYLPGRLTDSAEYRPVIQALVKAGADINAHDSSKRTPIFRAESDVVARALIEAKAEVNVFDEDNLTPLHVMLNNAPDDQLGALLEVMFAAGADPAARKDTGTSPRDHASAVGRIQAFDAALSRSQKTSAPFPGPNDRLVDSNGSSCCTIA